MTLLNQYPSFSDKGTGELETHPQTDLSDLGANVESTIDTDTSSIVTTAVQSYAIAYRTEIQALMVQGASCKGHHHALQLSSHHSGSFRLKHKIGNKTCCFRGGKGEGEHRKKCKGYEKGWWGKAVGLSNGYDVDTHRGSGSGRCERTVRTRALSRMGGVTNSK